MAQAIAQSVTQLTPGGVAGNLSDEYLFDALIEKLSKRNAKGMTRQTLMLNSNKLFSGVAAEFKSHRGLNRTDNLPQAVVDLLDRKVTDFVVKWPRPHQTMNERSSSSR
jgi:hypothetical protein